MKKKFDLVTSKCIYYGVNGIGWILYAILSIFDNSLCAILASMTLLCCIILSILGLVSSKEPDDEMSKYNMMRAKATAMDWLKIIACIGLVIIALLAVLHKFIPTINATTNISLGLIIPLLFGITELVICILFAKYEKAGE